MKSVDVILLGLTALVAGAGAGLVYRAHHQGDVQMPPVFTESAASAEKSPVRSPGPVDAARMQPGLRHGPHPSLVGKVECRNGLLYWHAPEGVRPVESPNHFPDAARCEIQVEPVRPQSSEAND